jgi:hypothetical protein
MLGESGDEGSDPESERSSSGERGPRSSAGRMGLIPSLAEVAWVRGVVAGI